MYFIDWFFLGYYGKKNQTAPFRFSLFWFNSKTICATTSIWLSLVMIVRSDICWVYVDLQCVSHLWVSRSLKLNLCLFILLYLPWKNKSKFVRFSKLWDAGIQGNRPRNFACGNYRVKLGLEFYFPFLDCVFLFLVDTEC